jgi:radical SAM family uncharacterized protein/radical SAM-linked protein
MITAAEKPSAVTFTPLMPNAGPLARRIEREFLPFVTKPGRYVGNEWGSIHKEHTGKVRVCLAFPDAYELGMSYLGTAILANLVNREEDCLAERVFAPWPDAEQRLRETGLPLFSLESFTPIRDFDVVGFSLSYELLYTNVLTMLDLGGIPLHAADRSERDPIVIGGGSIVYNPEPVAAFFDLFVIGDGEDAILEMLAVLREKRDGRINRREAIMRLAALPGVYDPAGYEAYYDRAGWFERIEPVIEGRPMLVQSRQTMELKNSMYPETPIVPFIEITHDRLSVEIMRGCVRNCRFCQAGYIYLPKRGRTVDDLIQHTLQSLNNSGWDEVTLLSLLSTDFKGLDRLAEDLADRLTPRRIALSLPSIRPGTFSIDLAKKISQVRRTGLTFAPEAGSVRMRKVINKKISDEDMLDNARAAFENGWRQIKLYFMIGLPGERYEDLDAIIDLTKRILSVGREAGISPQIGITISPFSPKSHTPFQWEAQDTIDTIHKKHAYLKEKVRRLPIHLKLRDPNVSFLEGVLGRGDRRFADVIETAWRNGARFDAWKEWFHFDLWTKAFTAHGLDPARWAAAIETNAPLPWAHLDKGNLTIDFLLRQRERAWEAAREEDGTTLGIEEMPFAQQGDVRETRATTEIFFPQFAPDEKPEFGRAPRRRRITPTAPVSPAKTRIRMRWQKLAPLRFTSHLDCMRTVERAMRRADLPVSYTEGFSPHMKISFGPPLPLGFVSDDEYFDLHLESAFADRMFRRLQAVLPRGLAVTDYRPVYNTQESLTAMLNRAQYQAEIDMPISMLEDRVAEFLVRDEVLIERENKGKILNIRPSVISIKPSEVDGGAYLDFTLKLGEANVAKPAEVLRSATGLKAEALAAAVVRRARLFTFRGGREYSPLDVA